MSQFYDSLETRTSDERGASLAECLPVQIAHARAKAPYYTSLLADIDPEAVTSRHALAALPVTRKSELMALQKRTPPLGGLNATPVKDLARLFMSPDRSMSRRDTLTIGTVSPARSMPPDSARVNWCTIPLPTT